MKKRLLIYFVVIIILVLLDQLTKLLIINSFDVNDKLVLINNFLKFYYIQNTGISFGILSNQKFIIILLTILIMIYVLYETNKNKDNKLYVFSSMLIVSGALGNLIDRIFRGYVIDFISFTLFNREMAIFNIADTLITFGIIMYIWILFMEGKNERNSSK